MGGAVGDSGAGADSEIWWGGCVVAVGGVAGSTGFPESRRRLGSVVDRLVPGFSLGCPHKLVAR
jgi:hypothetical protein